MIVKLADCWLSIQSRSRHHERQTLTRRFNLPHVSGKFRVELQTRPTRHQSTHSCREIQYSRRTQFLPKDSLYLLIFQKWISSSSGGWNRDVGNYRSLWIRCGAGNPPTTQRTFPGWQRSRHLMKAFIEGYMIFVGNPSLAPERPHIFKSRAP